MKSLLTVAKGKKFIYTMAIAFAAIWCLGPYLAIAGKMPFDSFQTRLLASIVIFLIFIATEFRVNFTQFSKKIPLPLEIENELRHLQTTIKNVLKILYSNIFKAFLFRYKKPWYLVVGPTSSGKSTFLHKADLNLKGLDNLPPMTIIPTKNFNWWLCDEAVFIDVSGRFFKNQKELGHHNQLLFKGFFKLLKRYRSLHPINGLILTINLQELTVNTRDQVQITNLREVINELATQFMHIPIYLVITRCDTIEGFVEFFEDLGPEERSQIFGISFPLKTEPEKLPHLFNDEYNALLTRLNERIIWRMNKEHSLDKIGKIKNFPLQMEFLKNPLAKLLNIILPTTNLNLRGIFFTSAAQKDTPFDNLTKTLSTAYDIHHVHSGYRSTPAKDYFIKQLFHRIIFQEEKSLSNVIVDGRSHFITSFCIISLTAACFWLFFSSYQASLQTIKQAIYTLNLCTRSTDNQPLFKDLEQLQTLLNALTKKQIPWYSKIGMQEPQKLFQKTEAHYDKLLMTEFFKYLQRTLEIQLQNIQDENSSELYAALKAYLILGKETHLDKHFLQTWFDNYWHQLTINTQQQEQLHHHLAALLKKELPSMVLNQQLIDSKRVLLNSIPQPRLVLTLLENHFQRSPIKIMPEIQGQNFNHLPREISGIYNIINFKTVYYQEIDKTCQEITKGDWVLGNKPQTAVSGILLTQLANDVKAIYLNEYAVTWSNLLAKVKIEQFHDLNQIMEMLDLLNNPKSPLIQLINIIKNNTQPLSDSVEFTQQVSSRFLALTPLSADMLKNTNQATLQAIRNYLSKITQSTDPDRSAYEIAKARMENSHADAIATLLQQSHYLPEPLQSWHTTIAAESWRLILKQSQNFLNRIWGATVYPQYLTLLSNRYPLFRESNVDISFNDFANFFGSGGLVDNFFRSFLQPFVNNSQLYWEWKNVDGQRINIPQATLEMFIRAALIQKMFFQEGAKQPTISFSLVPVELDSHVQSFTLNLEGQTLVFQKDNEQIITLNWPGPSPNLTEISFLDSQGQKLALSETGPWAWFRILDKSILESTQSPKHYKLTFRLNDNAVHYELYTNGVVNPFIPGILNTFRCPENLF